MTHKPFDCFLADYREILPLGTVVEWNFSCQLGSWLDDIVYHSFVRVRHRDHTRKPMACGAALVVRERGGVDGGRSIVCVGTVVRKSEHDL
ncbi:hypothetical protein RHMOL_Rhmol06G0172300 [Rhododendron molle]|uniref:Uncharacterized protein n=1 Tax=Rhododendron molle TaxID=49168 RepID=A0ACC0NEV3_RHOML|nr:hypothetical protein RHMOL_Rhmol06G0172300 [Rhododendron molle]